MTAKAGERGAESAYQVLSFQPQQEAQARKYIKRKSHRKSKGGCFGCKLSRVKCDELKPACTRCLRSKVDCRYAVQSKFKALSAPDPSPLDASSDATLALCYSPIPLAQPSLTAAANACLESKTAARGISRVSLLHHIQQHFASMQGLETAGGQIASVLRLGMSRPYLLDATLAVAASHLRHMYQQATTTGGPLQVSAASDTIAACRVAEHYQQSLAIKGFYRALAEPLDQDGADSVIISSMMLNLLSFALDEEEDPSQSWVFSNAPTRLAWFSLNMGLAPILMNTKEFHEKSILRYIFDSSDDEEKTYHGDDPKTLFNVPAHWLRLCGLEYHSDNPGHVLYEPVRILAELRPIPVTNQSFFLYMAFFGKLGTEFRALLEASDERAMWLLGFWLGMLCRFDTIWWMGSRSRRDYRAICIWLDRRRVRRRPGAEGALWRQLMIDLEGATQPPSQIEP